MVFILVFVEAVHAQSLQDSTKWSFSVFHPCPKTQMRSFVTDRPDATESPYTLDAGHFQFETDIFKKDISSANGIKTIVNSINGFNLKFGLTNSLDIQFISAFFVNTRVIDESTSETKTFFNNNQIRIKQNIRGNDKGKTALALLPFVNIPTRTDEKLTGGLIVPFSISFANDWSLGTQLEVDIERNQSGNGAHFNPLVSATVSHPLIRNFDMFLEGVITRETELNQDEYFIDSGLVYELGKRINLDTGIYYGIKNTSSRVYFIGLSFRY